MVVLYFGDGVEMVTTFSMTVSNKIYHLPFLAIFFQLVLKIEVLESTLSDF